MKYLSCQSLVYTTLKGHQFSNISDQLLWRLNSLKQTRGEGLPAGDCAGWKLSTGLGSEWHHQNIKMRGFGSIHIFICSWHKASPSQLANSRLLAFNYLFTEQVPNHSHWGCGRKQSRHVLCSYGACAEVRMTQNEPSNYNKNYIVKFFKHMRK